ncbi:MAG: hypothetical protein IJM59_13130 [Proteobacteria bacterium]|jgi:hypothetical protein|nr:hypothetical protein [Pseudomonadota bacterium]
MPMNKGEKLLDEDDALFDVLPEGTRIVIRDGCVTFENLTEDMLDVALSLNPDDPELKKRVE